MTDDFHDDHVLKAVAWCQVQELKHRFPHVLFSPLKRSYCHECGAPEPNWTCEAYGLADEEWDDWNTTRYEFHAAWIWAWSTEQADKYHPGWRKIKEASNGTD